MSQAAGNLILIVIVAAIVVLAVKGAVSHFRGESGCCGGGGSIKKIKPRRLNDVIAVKTITIEGMVCDNCSTRVQNALNSIDGISAKVNRSKKQAVIKLGKPLEDTLLEKTITDLGYTVREIA